MQRRNFLAAGLAATAATSAIPVLAQAGAADAPGPREYYQIRRYRLQSGPQVKLTEAFLAEALIPALNRLGIAPVGAFKTDIGPDIPTFTVIMPSRDLERLVSVDVLLHQDPVFVAAAAPFWNSPAVSPAFLRIESSLHAAFASWPRLIVPNPVDRAKQIFQLRTYESASYLDHQRKVEMIMVGEAKIFADAGFDQVFFGDTLIGAHEPSLTYLVSLPDLARLNPSWDAFRSHPDWKKLTADPRYGFEAIVSNITSLVLLPLSCSQI